MNEQFNDNEKSKRNKPQRGGGRTPSPMDEKLLEKLTQQQKPLEFGTFIGGTKVGSEHDHLLQSFPQNESAPQISGAQKVTVETPDYTAPVSPNDLMQDIYDELTLKKIPPNPNFTSDKEKITDTIKAVYTDEDYEALASLYRDNDYLAATIDGYDKRPALIRREVRATLNYLGYSNKQISTLFEEKINPLTDQFLSIIAQDKIVTNSKLDEDARAILHEMVQSVSDYLHTEVPSSTESPMVDSNRHTMTSSEGIPNTNKNNKIENGQSAVPIPATGEKYIYRIGNHDEVVEVATVNDAGIVELKYTKKGDGGEEKVYTKFLSADDFNPVRKLTSDSTVVEEKTSSLLEKVEAVLDANELTEEIYNAKVLPLFTAAWQEAGYSEEEIAIKANLSFALQKQRQAGRTLSKADVLSRARNISKLLVNESSNEEGDSNAGGSYETDVAAKLPDPTMSDNEPGLEESQVVNTPQPTDSAEEAPVVSSTNGHAENVTKLEESIAGVEGDTTTDGGLGAYRESVRVQNQEELTKLVRRLGEEKVATLPVYQQILALTKRLEWQLNSTKEDRDVRQFEINEIYSRLFDLYNSAIPVLERMSEDKYTTERTLGDGKDYKRPGQIKIKESISNKMVVGQEDDWETGSSDYARASESEEMTEAQTAHRKNFASTQASLSENTAVSDDPETEPVTENENETVQVDTPSETEPVTTDASRPKAAEVLEKNPGDVDEKVAEAFIGKSLESIDEVEVGKKYWLPRTAGGYTQGTAESIEVDSGKVTLSWREGEEKLSKTVHFSMLSVEEPFGVPQDEIVSENNEHKEVLDSTELKALYRNFSQAKQAFFSPELLEKKKNLTTIQQRLKSSKLPEHERKVLTELRDNLLDEIGRVEEAYKAAKEPYAEALSKYLNAKGTLTEEQVNLMIAGRFFARTKEQRYQAQENRSAELNEGEYRSYKDLEMERKEALLDLEQKSIFKRLIKGVEKIPPKYKMGLGGAVVAGSVASGGFVPVLLGIGAAVGTRYGVDKLGMGWLNRKKNVERIDQIKAFQVAQGLAVAERAFEESYQADKRNRKIVTGMGYAAGTGAAFVAGVSSRGVEIPGMPATVGDAWGNFATWMEQAFGKSETINPNTTDFYLGVGPEAGLPPSPEMAGGAPVPSEVPATPVPEVVPPPVVDSAVLEAAVETPSEMVTVIRGDNVWNLVEETYPEVFSTLTEDETNRVLVELIRDTQANPDLLNQVGIESGDINRIYPGQELNLAPLKEQLDNLVSTTAATEAAPPVISPTPEAPPVPDATEAAVIPGPETVAPVMPQAPEATIPPVSEVTPLSMETVSEYQPELVTVVRGDNVGSMLERTYPEVFAGRTQGETTELLGQLFREVQTDADMLNRVGIESGNFDRIYPGQELDLAPLKEELDTIVATRTVETITPGIASEEITPLSRPETMSVLSETVAGLPGTQPLQPSPELSFGDAGTPDATELPYPLYEAPRPEPRPFIAPETMVTTESFTNPEFVRSLDFIYRSEFGQLNVPSEPIMSELTERLTATTEPLSFAEVKEFMSAIVEREYVLQQMQPGNQLEAFNQVIRNESIASLLTEQGQARLSALEQSAPDLYERLARLINFLPSAVTSIDAAGSNGAYSLAELLEYGLKTDQLTLAESGQQLRGLSGTNLSLI